MLQAILRDIKESGWVGEINKKKEEGGGDRKKGEKWLYVCT